MGQASLMFLSLFPFEKKSVESVLFVTCTLTPRMCDLIMSDVTSFYSTHFLLNFDEPVDHS